jgi:hypothetical protein
MSADSAKTDGEITYREAARGGIRDALLRDPRVFLMGEASAAMAVVMASVRGCWRNSGPSVFVMHRCRSRVLPVSG